MERLTKKYENGFITLEAEYFPQSQATVDSEIRNSESFAAAACSKESSSSTAFSFSCAASFRYDLYHHVAAHVIFGILDHTFHHFAADRASLLGSDVTVVALLQIHVQGVCYLGLEVLQFGLHFLVIVAGH